MKKHFLLVGKAGLTYYSWLFVLLFIGLIIAYETTQKISWPATILIVLFCLLFGSSFFCSYFTEQKVVLPYRLPFKKISKIKKDWEWRRLVLYRIQVDSMHQYYVLCLKQKKKVE